jgi:tRNA(adenine34) deaminase
MPVRKKKGASSRRWSASVTTDSTHPPEGLFNKGAAVIARTLASKKVSPKGLGSGMRMLTFYINRAGHNLSAARKAELQKAKKLLAARIKRDKEKKVSTAR